MKDKSADFPAIDITVPMNDHTPLYPGDAPPQIQQLSSIEEGAPLTSSEITMRCHVGTHADAPAHFIRGGAAIDELDLRHFYGNAVVIEFLNRDCITAEDVAGVNIPSGVHVLLKTRNSALLHQPEFDEHYCYLAEDAVRAVLAFQPLSIGFDYYSLDPPSATHFPAHLEAARYGIPVFVCLDLTEVAAGEYFLSALPLPLENVEAIAVRAVLFRR